MSSVPLSVLQPRRIALIKPSALGDIVHSLPVLSALREKWPKAHITWVINRGYESLIKGHPHLNATLAFDRGAMKKGPVAAGLAIFQFMRRLRQAHFDLVIDLQGLLRTGLMSWMTGATRRVGFANAREGATRFYTDCVDVPDAEEIHAVDRYWRIVETLGAGNAEKKFLVPIASCAKPQAARMVEGLPRPWVVFAAGARWYTKRWPVENFAFVARFIQQRFGGTPIYIGGPEDRAISQGLAGLNLCGETSLPVLAAILQQADAVVGNDTGPVHLAAALGIPVVAPYTCTLIRKHGPYGQFHRAVSATVSCHGSYVRTCDHLSCMPTIPPQQMLPILEEILSSWQARRSA